MPVESKNEPLHSTLNAFADPTLYVSFPPSLFSKNEVIELIEIENLNHGQCIAFIKDRLFGKVRKVQTTFFSGLGKTGKIEMLKNETIEGYYQYIFYYK